jgi:hypothetical protein
MLSETKIALSAAIVLSTVFPASAATKYHRVYQFHRPIYNYLHRITVSLMSPPRSAVFARLPIIPQR